MSETYNCDQTTAHLASSTMCNLPNWLKIPDANTFGLLQEDLQSRYEKCGCCDVPTDKSLRSAYKDLCRHHIQDGDTKYSNLPYYIGPRLLHSFGMSDEAESVRMVEFKGRQYIQSTGMSVCPIVDANYVAIAESERTDHDLDNPPPYCDSRLPNKYPSGSTGPTAFSYDRYYSGKTQFSLGAHVNKDGTLQSMFPDVTHDKQTMKISFYIKDDGFENSFSGDKYMLLPFTTDISKYPVAYEEGTKLESIQWDTTEETQDTDKTYTWYANNEYPGTGNFAKASQRGAPGIWLWMRFVSPGKMMMRYGHVSNQNFSPLPYEYSAQFWEETTENDGRTSLLTRYNSLGDRNPILPLVNSLNNGKLNYTLPEIKEMGLNRFDIGYFDAIKTPNGKVYRPYYVPMQSRLKDNNFGNVIQLGGSNVDAKPEDCDATSCAYKIELEIDMKRRKARGSVNGEYSCRPRISVCNSDIHCANPYGQGNYNYMVEPLKMMKPGDSFLDVDGNTQVYTGRLRTSKEDCLLPLSDEFTETPKFLQLHSQNEVLPIRIADLKIDVTDETLGPLPQTPSPPPPIFGLIGMDKAESVCGIRDTFECGDFNFVASVGGFRRVQVLKLVPGTTYVSVASEKGNDYFIPGSFSMYTTTVPLLSNMSMPSGTAGLEALPLELQNHVTKVKDVVVDASQKETGYDFKVSFETPVAEGVSLLIVANGPGNVNFDTFKYLPTPTTNPLYTACVKWKMGNGQFFDRCGYAFIRNNAVVHLTGAAVSTSKLAFVNEDWNYYFRPGCVDLYSYAAKLDLTDFDVRYGIGLESLPYSVLNSQLTKLGSACIELSDHWKTTLANAQTAVNSTRDTIEAAMQGATYSYSFEFEPLQVESAFLIVAADNNVNVNTVKGMITYHTSSAVEFPSKAPSGDVCRFTAQGPTCSSPYVWTELNGVQVKAKATFLNLPDGCMGIKVKAYYDNWFKNGTLDAYMFESEYNAEFALTSGYGINAFSDALKQLLVYKDSYKVPPPTNGASSFVYYFLFPPLVEPENANLILTSEKNLNIGVDKNEVYHLGRTTVEPANVCRVRSSGVQCDRGVYYSNGQYRSMVAIKNVPAGALGLFFDSINVNAYFVRGKVQLYGTTADVNQAMEGGEFGFSMLPSNVQAISETILLDEIMLPDYTSADAGTPYTTLFRFKHPLPTEMNLFVVPNDETISGAVNYRSVHMILG